MKCSACLAQNDPGSRYCQQCGAALTVVCEKCSRACLAGAHFCSDCGHALRENAAFGLRTASTPPQSEFKHATVLIADIVSSTELVSRLDAEQAMDHLRPAVSLMCAIVEQFDGTVVRALGDGIMALFGAPRALEGHALLACEAALAMQERFRKEPTGLSIRIGLNSGEVVFSPTDSNDVAAQNVHGLTIHIASRVQSIAAPGDTALTDACHRLVRAYCNVESQGRHLLKGIATPVEIYRLLGLKPVVGSQSLRGTALSSFLGRDNELAIMKHTLAGVEDGVTRIIGIVGAPGTGKSRLCYEFATWCRNRLISVHEARAQPYGHATPLQPVLGLLRSLFFDIAPEVDAAVARRKIESKLHELGSTFDADATLMHEFLGVAADDAAVPSLSAKARRERLLSIVRHMVRASGAQTSVIIIEDLHWLDDASEEFVSTLADAVIGSRTMLVFNYRPSHSATWMQVPHYQELPLGELTPHDADSLVGELLGPHSDVQGLRERVAKRSGGNPFFAEELVRSLADNGVIVGIQGDYHLGQEGLDDALPATVQDVIGARLDHLEEREKSIVQTCAIIGKEMPLEVLESVAALPPALLEASLDALSRGGLLQQLHVGESRQVAFRHPLIQQVAYSTQLRARRVQIHAAVARAMERHYREHPDEFAGLIAYHYEAAGENRRAAEFAARAAAWVGVTNSAQAIKDWRKVRDLIKGQPRTQDNDALYILASAQIAWRGWREGLTVDEAAPFVRDALARAREADDSMIPLLLFVEGRIIVASGGPADVYVDRVREALAIVDAGKDPSRFATLNAALSHAYGWSGMLTQALAANDVALANVSSVSRSDTTFLGYSIEHWVISLRGRLLARLNRLAEARHCLDSMIEIGQHLFDPTVQIISHFGYLDVAWCGQDKELAHHHAQRILHIADRYPSPYLRVFALAGTGMAKLIAGQFAESCDDWIEGIEFVRKTRAAMETESEMLANLAECHYRRGNHAAARSVGQEAIALARQRSARLPECRALMSVAGAIIRQDGQSAAAEAGALLDRAAALIANSGASIYQPLLTSERTALAECCGSPHQ